MRNKTPLEIILILADAGLIITMVVMLALIVIALTGCEKKEKVKTKCVSSHIELRLRTYYSNGHMRYTHYPTAVCDEWEVIE